MKMFNNSFENMLHKYFRTKISKEIFYFQNKKFVLLNNIRRTVDIELYYEAIISECFLVNLFIKKIESL